MKSLFAEQLSCQKKEGSRKMDKYPQKKYPIIGVCGLDCGLCPRYHTEGQSKCPGCCGPDFWEKHPSCGFITCCVKKKELETCAQCTDLANCERIAKVIDSAKHLDSFISYQPVPGNLDFIRKNGIEEFAKLELQKQELLLYLLDNFDDGRSKSFYCTSCQVLPIDKLKDTLANVEKDIPQNMGIKEKAKLVKEAISKLAKTMQIDLRLRR